MLKTVDPNVHTTSATTISTIFYTNRCVLSAGLNIGTMTYVVSNEYWSTTVLSGVWSTSSYCSIGIALIGLNWETSTFHHPDNSHDASGSSRFKSWTSKTAIVTEYSPAISIVFPRSFPQILHISTKSFASFPGKTWKGVPRGMSIGPNVQTEGKKL